MVPPLYLAGPTGSGKTAVALALARLLAPCEILNADAFQVYRGMEILSAAPSEDDAVPARIISSGSSIRATKTMPRPSRASPGTPSPRSGTGLSRSWWAAAGFT